jgi:Domain of unknown function (DUF6538)
LSFPYLHQRNSTYYFRIRIPQDVQQWFSSKEIRRSLKTTDKQLAKLQAMTWARKSEKVFAFLRSEIFTPEQVHDLIQKHFPSPTLLAWCTQLPIYDGGGHGPVRLGPLHALIGTLQQDYGNGGLVAFLLTALDLATLPHPFHLRHRPKARKAHPEPSPARFGGEPKVLITQQPCATLRNVHRFQGRYCFPGQP